MKIRYLSNREIKKLASSIKKLWNIDLESDDVKAVYLKKGELLVGKPTLIRVNEKLYPFLKEDGLISKLPKAVIDMGAVPHIVNGANVMRPGILSIDECRKGDVVVVVDERHGKALAIGEMLVDYEEFSEMKKGVVIKNVHYIGDEFWEAAKSLRV